MGTAGEEAACWDLRADVLHVWRVFLRAEAQRLEPYAATLSEDEQSRAQRYRFERDRNDFVAGRGVLRSLLGRYLGLVPEQIRFVYGNRGKPALAPELKTPLRFNVSHSDGLLLCVVTANRAVGVDVERVRWLPDLEEVAGCVFCPHELAVLRGLVERQEKQQAFFRCWTRKEAYIKADGEGFSLPVQQIEVSIAPGKPAELVRRAGRGAEARRWSLRDFDPAPGYVGAVAAEGHGWQVRCWNWQPKGPPALSTASIGAETP